MVAAQVDHMVSDFHGVLKFYSTFDRAVDEKWIPPSIREWKMNCDAAFKNGMAAVSAVLRDDCGTLIKASSMITNCLSAFEAEVKAVEWAVALAVKEGERNLVLSTDTLSVVKEFNSN